MRIGVEVWVELLEQHTDLEVIGNKGYSSAPRQAELRHNNQIELMTFIHRQFTLNLAAT